MKIWEIKAQALRLMFSDTDLEFSEEEFTSNAVYENANTREKLVRMNDSIQRGIDLYYQFVGDKTNLASLTMTLQDTFGNYVSVENNKGYPLRVDFLIYKPAYCTTSTYTTESTCEDNGGTWFEEEKVLEINQVSFYYHELGQKLYFQDKDYLHIYKDFIIKLRYMYKPSRVFITSSTNDQSDVSTDVPTEVQYMLPYFVKGELYEEDEPNLAAQARNLFTQFLLNTRKPFANNQSKVKRARVFSK
jgi:hypothetical protein